jgi:biofilm PGA synthesis N-glycosyltransferase PgaC
MGTTRQPQHTPTPRPQGTATPRPRDTATPRPRVLIVSPVRNEGAHIARVARALAAQQSPPARWVVIDDCSSDDTLEQLSALREQLPFLTIMQAPVQAPGARDRLAQAVEVRNFNLALAAASSEPSSSEPSNSEPSSPEPSSSSPRDSRPYTHVMKLDGDIELPPDYLRLLLERFAADPRLGLAGGVLVEPACDGALRRIGVPPHHVHGALKCWTDACLTAIGGVSERLGWDTIDETYARMRGFHTRNFTDLVCVHHRPLASADGALRGHARHGECAYIVHYTPVWVALRAAKVARRRPFGLSGVAFLWGYLRAAVRRVPQVPDPAYRSFTRRELRGRMLRAGVAR